MLDFQLAVPAEGLITVNPEGKVALCTLWTPPAFVKKRLEESCPELLMEDSPLAVIGGLYGGGLKIMLRNLHYNPQLEAVALYGRDFSGAGEHLKKFFRGELSRSEKKRVYVFPDGERRELGTLTLRGAKSVYVMDDLLLPEMFSRIPEVADLTRDGDPDQPGLLKSFLSGRSPGRAPLSRPEKIPLPLPLLRERPADADAFAVSAPSVLSCWEEILFRLSRFGVPRVFRNGKERRELRNFKAVITKPLDYDPRNCSRAPYHLDPSRIGDYAEELFRRDAHDGFAYTYGNRLRAHFGLDSLEKMATDLSRPGDSRRAYAALWDNSLDLESDSAPCLVSVFFRRRDGEADLTACFRSHNAAKAWPLNAFGLAGLLKGVVELAGKEGGERLSPGSLTIISHSLTLDPSDLAAAEEITSFRDERPWRMAMDPHGHFKIRLDRERREIVAEHYSGASELLEEYRGKTPHDIFKRLEKDLAVSGIGHALYLGSQLERAWLALLRGGEYVQDKNKPDL
ncbi:MAG: hypothetical protein LBR53_10425 [Deltaproteobacteria bacterium]|nr:hypothetical protein [Deltaproteobacteria bacterium]